MKRVLRSSCIVLAGLVVAPVASAQEETGTVWKSHAELSYVRTDGNSDTETFAAKLESSADATPNRYFLKATGLYSEADDVTSSSRWYLGSRYERALSERAFAFAAADYLKDTYAGYDARVTVGPGAGYQFLNGEVHTLKGMASVLWVWENVHATPEPTDDTESYAAGKVEGNYAWQIREDLRFKQDADFQVSFEDADVHFINSVTALEMQLRNNLSVGLSYTINYQNAPAPGARYVDRKFLASLVLDF